MQDNDGWTTPYKPYNLARMPLGRALEIDPLVIDSYSTVVDSYPATMSLAIMGGWIEGRSTVVPYQLI